MTKLSGYRRSALTSSADDQPSPFPEMSIGMPKSGKPVKSRGRSGRLWENARAKCLATSQICWICAGECDDFKWEVLPFESAAIDMTLEWPLGGSASVDHKIPISELAPDDPRLWRQDNLAPAHLRCNSARGDGKREKRLVTKTSRVWVA